MKLATPQELHEELKKSVINFVFLKKDRKEEREAFGTLNMDFIPEKNRATNLKENSFFDIQKQQWRSMKKNAQFYIKKTILS